MPFPTLRNYLARLPGATQAGTSVWLDAEGRAQGRYFNSTLTSAFQAVRAVGSNAITAYEAFVRSYSETDQGLSLWKLLDHAANDDESIELDRLCRMLHAINFFRQPEALGADLFVSVHARLLAAVDSNHGIAFSRILNALELPQEKVVLQLPAVVEQQRWLLNYVSDNYRRNGFRFAVNAANVKEARDLLERVRPDVMKVDARELAAHRATVKLLSDCSSLGVQVIFKRVENIETLNILNELTINNGQTIYAQGFLWDSPKASLTPAGTPGDGMPAPTVPISPVGAD
jgi:EAL domain-containing protein (putative c-di-GMP-specific phosphodiesterase class I)